MSTLTTVDVSDDFLMRLLDQETDKATAYTAENHSPIPPGGEPLTAYCALDRLRDNA